MSEDRRCGTTPLRYKDHCSRCGGMRFWGMEHICPSITVSPDKEQIASLTAQLEAARKQVEERDEYWAARFRANLEVIEIDGQRIAELEKELSDLKAKQEG